jgi:SAM-dependent methyltransferase
MGKKVILFVSHKKAQCGVYEFGKKITDVLSASLVYDFVRAECSSFEELRSEIKKHSPDAIIYNYTPSVMSWLTSKVAPKLIKNRIAGTNAIQVGIIHDVTQHIADTATAYRKKFLLGGFSKTSHRLFDYYIAPDPTLLLRNPLVYKTGRLIPYYENNFSLPSVPTFGSFGFGTPKKGFDKIIQRVQDEFDEAVIRINIPAADFGDRDGDNARAIAKQCKELVKKPGIRLQITHDFLNDKELLDFLAQNSVNVFLYEDAGGRGLSSAVDNAMAVKRAIAVSDSVMFRHILDAEPSVCITKNNLRSILQNGFTPLEKHYREWTDKNLLWEYERILDSIFAKQESGSKVRMGIVRTVQSYGRRFFSLPDKSFTWLRNTEQASDDDLSVDKNIKYQPLDLPSTARLNRILDNEARALYQPAINKLFELVPKTMAKKIPEANVQQAFVFDTVNRFIRSYTNPEILCVGSYEDTASMALRKMGFKVEEIDPMINYYLQEYFSKPSVKKNSFNIIFSTSVIEHDPDDESFIKCIGGLLAPGGVAVITCDFNDQWKPGDPKPEVDARFYTQKDLKQRLLSLIPDCHLVDEPQWDCPDPDFCLAGKYQYTFASFVIKKNK